MMLKARPLVPGRASGPTLMLTEPLSFWGGFDARSGEVVDAQHAQHGAGLTGRVVLMPGSRGSSSSSAMLAEAVRLGTAPAALILSSADGVLALGAIVGEELYGDQCPVLTLDGKPLPAVPDGSPARVLSEPETGVGQLEVLTAPPAI